MHRRQFFSLVSAGAIAALIAVSPVHAADAAVDVVNGYLAAWNAHDVEAAAAFFSPDVTYFDASVGTPVVGMADAKTKIVASFINAAPDLKWEMQGDPIVDGEHVAFQWRFSGNNTGAWGDGTEAANKPFDFKGASVFVITGGKIVAQSDYYDALGFYRQLGWME